MARKSKHVEDNDSASREEVGRNTETFSDNVQLTASSSTEPVSPTVDSLSQVYSAFTASTLSQQPLIDGNYSLLSFVSAISDPILALEIFDRCMASVDWSCSNLDHDMMINYFTTNNDFLPTMVNLWGFSWEVSNESDLCCPSLIPSLAKFPSSYRSNLRIPTPFIERVIKATPHTRHFIANCAHCHRSPTQNYLSHIVLRKGPPDDLHHRSNDPNCLCSQAISFRYALSISCIGIQCLAEAVSKKRINEGERDFKGCKKTQT